MVCSSGVGFDPVVDGTRYRFDNAGLYNGLFVMADRTTGSVWTHYDGTVLQGPLAEAGARLEIVPLVHLTWEDWKAEYPDSRVMDWIDEFAQRYREVDPGRPGLSETFTDTIQNFDDRLAQNELVLGVGVSGEYRAYVLADQPAELTVVHDILGGEPIAVFIDPSSSFGIAYSTRLDGETLELFVSDGEVVDASGSVWNSSGRAVSGPRAGSQLTFVTSFVTEWYGWVAYHPETSIYGE